MIQKNQMEAENNLRILWKKKIRKKMMIWQNTFSKKKNQSFIYQMHIKKKKFK